MGWDLWRLLPGGLCIRDVSIDADRVTVSMVSTAESSACPLCGRASSNVHRYCERTLADLPWAGRVVQLRVRARHFYCRNPSCPRRTYSERMTGIANVYARRTDRLIGSLLGIGYELGGEAGSRRARDLVAGWSGWGGEGSGMGDMVEQGGEFNWRRCGGPSAPIEGDARPGAQPAPYSSERIVPHYTRG